MLGLQAMSMSQSPKAPLVVVVDDEPDICEIITYTIEEHGYRVLVAYDTDAALELVKNYDVDLVISDIRMPKGGGVKLLKEIKKINPDKPKVILLTGYNTKGTTEEALAAGALTVLSKPIKLADLVSAITAIFK
jgi:CheY-like chemotaxis protein